MLKNKKAVFFFFSTILLIVDIFLYLYPIFPLCKTNLLSKKSDIKIYRISPVLYYQRWENGYINPPQVSVSPKDLKYPLVKIKEKVYYTLNFYDNLFYAEKRISEIRKWGNDLDINQWKYRLADYQALIKDYQQQSLLNPPDNNRLQQFFFIHQKLNIHEIEFRRNVDNSSLPYQQKTALNNEIVTTFKKLRNNLDQQNQIFDPKYSYYLLDPIINNQEFGVYSVSDSKDIKTTTYKKINFIPNTDLDHYYKVKTPLPIINFKYYQDIDQDDQNQTYRYQFISDKKLYTNTTYIAQLSIKGIYRNEIVLDQKIDASNSAQLINQTVYPNDKINTISIVLTSPEFNKPPDYPSYITIKSIYSIPTSELSSFNIKLIPISKDILQFNKIKKYFVNQTVQLTKLSQHQYEIKYENVPQDKQDQISRSCGLFWQATNKDDRSILTFNLPKYIAILLITGWLAFFFSSYILRLIKYIRKIINKFIAVFIQITVKFRYLLLLLSFLLIYMDIFENPKYNNNLLPIIIIWFLYNISFKLTALANFAYALFFMSLIPVFLIIDKEIYAEKVAIWAYTMLIIGIILLLTEIKFNKVRENNFKIHLNEIGTKLLIIPLYLAIINFFILNIKRIFRIIIIFINIRPKSKKEFVKSFIKFNIVVACFLLLILSTVKTTIYLNNFIYQESQKKQRMLLNPDIYKVEPKIVYRSNKVIILGNNFGWKNSKSSNLYSQYGTVITDLWTDSKIIFTVPLHWNNGNINIWIEKQIEWRGRKITAKSDTVAIRLIPTTDTFTSDDELYFKQLNNLEPETLEQNGYK